MRLLSLSTLMMLVFAGLTSCVLPDRKSSPAIHAVPRFQVGEVYQVRGPVFMVWLDEGYGFTMQKPFEAHGERRTGSPFAVTEPFSFRVTTNPVRGAYRDEDPTDHPEGMITSGKRTGARLDLRGVALEKRTFVGVRYHVPDLSKLQRL